VAAVTARGTRDGPQDGDQDDARLVREAAGGSITAFEGLYRRYERRIYALCLRMTGSRDQAEDCVQETFVQAWQKLASFEGRSAFGTWLHRIAVNKVLSVQRYDSRRPRLAPVDETLSDPYGAAPATVDAGAQMDLEQAIGRLPDGARNVFVLHAVHGYSHEETAGMLGVAVGTCKAQLHRARRLLGERLDA
jgi:RNA polymerase sigma-70 factor (ECF subfamily)